jgi:hypothetical protein
MSAGRLLSIHAALLALSPSLGAGCLKRQTNSSIQAGPREAARQGRTMSELVKSALRLAVSLAS